MILGLLMLPSCAKKDFKIEFNLDKSVEANYRVNYLNPGAKGGGGEFMELIVPIAGGAYKLQCRADAPTIVTITPTAGGTPLIFYARPGDKIKLSGKDANPFLWTVSGNDVDEQWSRWRLENEAPLQHAGASTVNDLISKYVKAHKEDELSAILLITTYDRYADEAGFRKLWNLLPAELKSQKILSTLNRADLFETITKSTPTLPKTFQARYGDDSLVTVNMKDAKATLFWFRTGEEPGNRAQADSIRKFFRARAKAAGRSLRLATVSFDSDSSAMRRAAQYDSVPGQLKLWEPMAEAGAIAEKMSVHRYPYFIVADSLGREMYRGEDPAKALKALRKIK